MNSFNFINEIFRNKTDEIDPFDQFKKSVDIECLLEVAASNPLPCVAQEDDEIFYHDVLVYACRQADHALIQRFIDIPESKRKTSILNVINDRGLTLLAICLQTAFDNNNHQTLELLLSLPQAYDLCENLLYRFIHESIELCKLDMLKVLIQSPRISIYREGESDDGLLQLSYKHFNICSMTQVTAIDQGQDLCIEDYVWDPDELVEPAAFPLIVRKLETMLNCFHFNPGSNFASETVAADVNCILLNAARACNYQALYILLNSDAIYSVIKNTFDYGYFVNEVIKKGDLMAFNILMAHPVDMILQQYQETSTSFTAVQNERPTILKKLVETCYSLWEENKLCTSQKKIQEPEDYIFLNQCGQSGTSIILAARFASAKCLEYLLGLKNYCRYIGPDSGSGCALLCAVSANSLECVRLLVEHGANILCQCFKGLTALEKSIVLGYDDITNYLIAKVCEATSHLESTNPGSSQHIDYIRQKQRYIMLGLFDPKSCFSVNLKHFSNFEEARRELRMIKNQLIDAKQSGQGKLRHLLFQLDGFAQGNGVIKQHVLDLVRIYSSSATCLRPLYDYEDKAGQLFLPFFDESENIDRHLETMYDFGTLMFLCFVYNRTGLNISPAFFKFLNHREIELSDIMPKSVVDRINLLHGLQDQEIRDLCLTFTIRTCSSRGEDKTYELIPRGSEIELSRDNLYTYVLSLKDFFMVQGKRKLLLDSFRKGFYEFLDDYKINTVFNSSELMMLTVCKRDRMAVDDLKNMFKIVHPIGVEPLEIGWFWEYVSSIDDRKYFRLIEFITSSNNLRGTGLCATISYNSNVDHDRLPTAQTCFNTLHLGPYSSSASLCKMFDMALQNFDGFHFV